MKICIVGAGAIGGYLGAKLALSGEEVTLIALRRPFKHYSNKWFKINYRHYN